MKDLEKEYCYDTIDLSECQKVHLFNWLLSNDEGWGDITLKGFKRFIYWSSNFKEFLFSDYSDDGTEVSQLEIKNALELFETEENLNNTNMKVTDLTETRAGKIKPMYSLDEDMNVVVCDYEVIKKAKECILIDRQVKYRTDHSILHLDVMYFKFEDSYCNCVVLGYFNSGVL